MFFNKWANPDLFIFSFFSNTILQKKFSVIQTGIVGVEGEHANHLTTTTALINVNCLRCQIKLKRIS